eukprot:TRINITY_DN2636_c0_g1_i2.p1 TRINITY_DN2636_c0_g1~~TRINITY_DN2636_c0_g1_i2.p1  ORF type:complete len:255 (+),score=33.05 TRINITY_DN2636_c0_g1_i2:677-1441(+)
MDPMFEGPWKEHLIAGPDQFAPDFFFDLERNATDGTPTGYATAATYFGKKIVLYWGGPLAGTGDAAAAPQFQSMVIDDTIGNGYAAAFVDVDGDGVNEIVATNHVSSNYDGAVSGVYVYYTAPRADRTSRDNWHRATLAEGFACLKKGRNQASLGQARPFHPFPARATAGQAPWFLVPGDGAGGAWVLFPDGQVSSAAGKFSYAIAQIDIWPGVTIGQPVLTVLGPGDGTDFLIPLYEKGEIYRFSFGSSAFAN